MPTIGSVGYQHARSACHICWQHGHSVGARLACDGVGGVSVSAWCLHRGQARLLQASAGSVGAGLPAMASVGCQRVRGVCIAGKPGSYGLRGLCWSRLACDSVGGVSVSSRRLYRGQARLLQATRALLEQACLRWRRRGIHEFAASASRASPAPTGCAGPVGAGLPAIASVAYP